MKKSAFTAILAIATIVLSSLVTPCRAQVMSPETLEKLEKNNVLPVAEQMPEFPGGMPALMEYLKKEVRYPKKCREAGVEGRAIITFVVKKNGKVKDFEVARSSGNKLLDKEAMRVIKKMPKWKPGMHEGKNVNVMFALPISFKLR
ncbi:MAG: energy transducer TonB [Bacteroidaceae bacterium]|nr:energy transducer TonB [Bacteroidaceae bacterium]